MSEFSKEDLKKQVYDRGLRFTELEKEAKALRREIEDRKERLTEIARLQDRELYAIKALEVFLDEPEQWTQWHRTNKKDGDPLSLAALITQALEATSSTGLAARMIYNEIRKLGWRTDSKDPFGMVVATLHRRKDIFSHLKNKNWCLKKYIGSASLNEEANYFAKNLIPPVPAGQSGAPLPEGIRRLKLQK